MGIGEKTTVYADYPKRTYQEVYLFLKIPATEPTAAPRLPIKRQVMRDGEPT